MTAAGVVGGMESSRKFSAIHLRASANSALLTPTVCLVFRCLLAKRLVTEGVVVVIVDEEAGEDEMSEGDEDVMGGCEVAVALAPAFCSEGIDDAVSAETFKHDCNLFTSGMMEARRTVSKVGKAFSSLDKAPRTSASSSGLRRRKSSPDSVPESSITLLGLDCDS